MPPVLLLVISLSVKTSRMSHFLRHFSLVLPVFLPIMAGAEAFDGIYKQTATSECALVGVDGGAVEIRDGIFYGVEVECRMTRPVNVLEMDAQLFTMQCSGEDQAWTERAMLMNSAEDDGIIMIWDGYAFVYEACEEG